MKIQKLYDNIAATYNQKASADVLSDANDRAFSYVKNKAMSFGSILALGIGDGAHLIPYKQYYPKSSIHGLDISEKMLFKAKALLGCKVYQGDIASASTLIGKQDFDLILAHFVCAYVPVSTILKECKLLMSDHAQVSIVTNTMASFSKMQLMFEKMRKSVNPFNKLIGHYIKQTLKTVFVPKNLDDLKLVFAENGMKISESSMVDIKINLKTEQEVFEFFVDGGWFASGLAHPLVPKKVLHNVIRRLIHDHVSLPYEDTLQVVIALGGY